MLSCVFEVMAALRNKLKYTLQVSDQYAQSWHQPENMPSETALFDLAEAFLGRPLLNQALAHGP